MKREPTEVPTGLSRDEFRTWYREEYLKTKHWREFRDEIRKHYDCKCQSCGNEAYDVHHLKYKLFRETIDCVKLLCRHCHEVLHYNKDNGTNLSWLGMQEHKRQQKGTK